MSRRGENIFKRKDGRWEARYIHHYEGGKAKYRYIYGSSYMEAKAKRLAELKSRDIGLLYNTKHSSKFSKLAFLWLCDIKLSVKESTYSRYHRIVTKYLMMYFGNLDVNRIDSQAVNRMISNLSTQGGLRQTPLAPKTISYIITVLKSIWHYGITNGFPCRELNGIRLPQKQKRPVKILPDDVIKKIENLLLNPGDTTCMGIVFSMFTGLRIGEICGLKWGDIDIESGTVSIRRTVERIADTDPNAAHKTKVIISAPKTCCSARIIPLPRFLCEYIMPYRMDAECFILTGRSTFTEPHGFYIKYKRFLKENGLENCTFHALRHTFATRCIEAGFDVKSLSEILGHSSVATTMSLYVHPTMEMKRVQMERLAPDFILQSE